MRTLKKKSVLKNKQHLTWKKFKISIKKRKKINILDIIIPIFLTQLLKKQLFHIQIKLGKFNQKKRIQI